MECGEALLRPILIMMAILDIVAGNLGLNCYYKVSSTEPMQLFATDIDGNGSIDPVLFYYIKDNGRKKAFVSCYQQEPICRAGACN